MKQIEDPYVFDWENAIALHVMQGNRASSKGCEALCPEEGEDYGFLYP